MEQRQRRGRERVQRVAQETFGYDQLRPGQEAATRAILDGHDTLTVMPTGSGKSLIYQVAATLLGGPTVIISPLIALQRDQVENIEEQDIGKAALVNSTIKAAEWHEAFEELKEGDLEFLFLAPEQFANEETLQQLKEAKPSLFVVDEAHCISEWGHDFRPDYLRLGAVIEELGHPRVLALTATAAPPVREEILERLHMHDPLVVVRGFDRPNIWLGVEAFHDEATKKQALIERVQEVEKPGIVYVATRKHAEEVSQALQAGGVKADFYHAGMKTKDRERVQEAFMHDEIEVIVATTAFGMGIDKADVRFVFHYDISDSVDSYYQEIGRAGRDGKVSKAILFYNPKDVNLQLFFASSGKVETDQVVLTARVIQEHGEPVAAKTIQEELDISQTKLAQILSRLEEIGVIEFLPTGDVALKEKKFEADEVAEDVVETHEQYRQFERSRVEMMRGYAEVMDCRREYLLNYFGEEYDEPCDFCDNCDRGIVVEEDEANLPFPLNTRVMHKTWGEGLVMRYEGDKMVILFDSVGYKTLAVDIVEERHLLLLNGE
jgi:ATP-dependent DNA helicase RecQ